MSDPGQARRAGHFQSGADDYAAARPVYPPELSAALAAVAPGRGLAVDVGCGSGQLTLALAGHFEAVAGVDVSPAQLAAAPRHPRIRWLQGGAEALPVADGAADLLVVAQAAHWFDLPVFYAEARRVLCAQGVIALVTYGPAQVSGPLSARFACFYDAEIAPFWPPERAHVENAYRDLPFPFPRIPMPPLAIGAEWPLSRLLGYVRSWSAARAPGADAVVAAFHEGALAMLAPDAPVAINFPLTVIAGRIAA